jgi:hypothetical protein
MGNLDPSIKVPKHFYQVIRTDVKIFGVDVMAGLCEPRELSDEMLDVVGEKQLAPRPALDAVLAELPDGAVAYEELLPRDRQEEGCPVRYYSFNE